MDLQVKICWLGQNFLQEGKRRFYWRAFCKNFETLEQCKIFCLLKTELPLSRITPMLIRSQVSKDIMGLFSYTPWLFPGKISVLGVSQVSVKVWRPKCCIWFASSKSPQIICFVFLFRIFQNIVPETTILFLNKVLGSHVGKESAILRANLGKMLKGPT